ncbi:hypothetical protein [Halococcoides cellulosivorans]|uniref:Uncharacterized protein n=1 Tax=Halococcoides cellulosivorans TaxID=1679096 RepID=A0A2R4X400_9EURY|nr:hypothetical protein [Halococcoides cellulosivorans]AWB28526.1 hypothetical protein HARCEL1_12955 [Halococcoides cellulosivorans]
MRSRRTVLQNVGVGAGTLLAPSVLAAEDDGLRADLSKTRSTVVTVDLRIEDRPEDSPRVSGSSGSPPIEIGEGGTVFVSESDHSPNFSRGADVVIAGSNQRFHSAAVGEDVSLSEGIRSFRSVEGDLIGELQTEVHLNVAAQRSGTNGEGGSSPAVTLRIGNRETTLHHRESAKERSPVRIRYQDSDGNWAVFETVLVATVEHLGTRNVVDHPSYRILPSNHRLANQARHLMSEQPTNGTLRLDTKDVRVEHSQKYGAFVLYESSVSPIGGDA